MSRRAAWKVMAPAAVTLMVLFGAGPAFAQSGLAVADDLAGYGVLLSNPQSIESETTFSLMENEGDFIWEPAELGALKGWKRDRTIGNQWDPAAKNEGGWFLLSNLGNTVSQDAYQIGAWGKLGPGNLAFVLSYDKTSDKDQGEYLGDYRDVWGTWDGDTWTAVAPYFDQTALDTWLDESEQTSTDLYVAYGLPIGDRASMGFSWRHGTTKLTPGNYSDAYGTASVEYDAFDDPTSYVTYTYNESGLDTYKMTRDTTKDELAFEYKMRPSDTFSFKVRGTYSTGSRDYTDVSGVDYAENDNDYSAGEGLPDGTVYATGTHTMASTDVTDMSYDATEWGLGGKINWYRGTGGLQIDLAYTQGKFDFKNSRLNESTYGYAESYSHLVGDTMTEYYNDSFVEHDFATLGSQDLTSKSWLIGAKYLWKWDNVDFLAGLRYGQSKYEAGVSGTMVENNTDTYIDYYDELPVTWVDHWVYGGTFAETGTVDTKRIELPLAVIVHMTDKLALRFGVQHTFSTRKANETVNSEWNAYSGDYTATDGTELLYEYYWVDDVSYERSNYSNEYKSDTSTTSYRLGLEYKVNDHVVADLLINEGSGGNSSRKQVDLGYVVAGVSIRF